MNTFTFCWMRYSATFVIRKAAYTCKPDTVNKPAMFKRNPNISFLKYLTISILLKKLKQLKMFNFHFLRNK